MINKIKELRDWVKNIFTIDQANNLIHYIKSDLYNDINFAANDIYQTFRRWFIFLKGKGDSFIEFIKDLIYWIASYVHYFYSLVNSGCKVIYNVITFIIPNFIRKKTNQTIDLIIYFKNNIFEFINDKINKITKIIQWLDSWRTFDWKNWILSWNNFDVYNWLVSVYHYLLQYDWYQLYLHIIRFNWSKWIHYSIFDINSEFHKIVTIIYYCTYYILVQVIYTIVWVIWWYIVFPTAITVYPYIHRLHTFVLDYHMVTRYNYIDGLTYEEKIFASPLKELLMDSLEDGIRAIAPYLRATYHFVIYFVSTYWTYFLYAAIVFFIFDMMYYRWYWYGHMYVAIFCYMLKQQGAYPHWSYFIWICWFIFLQSKIFYPFYFWYDDYKADTEARNLRRDIAHQSKLYVKEQERQRRIAAGYVEITLYDVYIATVAFIKTNSYYIWDRSFVYFILFITVYNRVVFYEAYVVLCILYYILRGFIYAFIFIPIIIIYIYIKIILQIILNIVTLVAEVIYKVIEFYLLLIIELVMYIFKLLKISNVFLTLYSFCKFILSQLITKLKAKLAYRYRDYITIYYEEKKYLNKEIPEAINRFSLFKEKMNNKVLIFYKKCEEEYGRITLEEIELLMEHSIKKILNFLLKFIYFCTYVSLLLIDYPTYKFIIHSIFTFYKFIIHSMFTFYKMNIEWIIESIINDIRDFCKRNRIINDMLDYYKRNIEWIIESIRDSYEKIEIIKPYEDLIYDIVTFYNFTTTLIVNFIYNLNLKINKHKKLLNKKITSITDTYNHLNRFLYQGVDSDSDMYTLKNKLIYIFEKYYLIIKLNLSFVLGTIKETIEDIKKDLRIRLISRFIISQSSYLLGGLIFGGLSFALYFFQLSTEGLAVNKFFLSLLASEYMEFDYLYTHHLYEYYTLFPYINELEEPLYYLTREELEELKGSKKFRLFRDQILKNISLDLRNYRELIHFAFRDPLDFNKNFYVIRQELNAYYKLKHDDLFNEIIKDLPRLISTRFDYFMKEEFFYIIRIIIYKLFIIFRTTVNCGVDMPQEFGDYYNNGGFKFRMVFLDEFGDIDDDTEIRVK